MAIASRAGDEGGADRHAHRAAHEGEVLDPDDGLRPSILPSGVDQRVALAGLLPRGLDPVGVALGSRNLSGSSRTSGLGRLIFLAVEQQRRSARRADPVVMVAARADIMIVLPFLGEDHRGALLALVPEIVGASAAWSATGCLCGRCSASSSNLIIPRPRGRRGVRHVHLKRPGDRARRGDRVFAAPVIRPADHQDRGAGVERLAGSSPASGRRPALSGPDAGNDEEAVRPQSCFAAATSLPEQTMPSSPASRASAASRSTCAWAVAVDPDRGEIVTVEAGQHGHRHHLRAGRRRRLGVLEHRPPAGGMDGQHRRLERRSAWIALATVFGMSCSLRSRKIGRPSSASSHHSVPAVGAEEFEAELQPAGMVLDPRRDRLRPFQVGRVDRDEDRAPSCRGQAAAGRDPPRHGLATAAGGRVGDMRLALRLEPPLQRPQPGPVDDQGRQEAEQEGARTRTGSFTSACSSPHSLRVTAFQFA